jgi:chromosome segregation ATPase
MQLFSKKEVQKDYDEQKAAVILETVKITKALAEKTNDLNRLNDELKLKKLTNERDYKAFIEPLTISKNALETTVWELEKRKSKALEPLQEFETSLKAKAEWLEVRMQEIASKEFQTSQLHEQVEQTLREAKTSLAVASKEKANAISLKTSAEQKVKLAQAEAKKLREETQVRCDAVAHEEEKLERKYQALDHDRDDLNAQELLVDEKRKELKVLESKIADDRQKLKSALDLMKTKYATNR